jgi:tetratricopeptide (TPR) repeat protein
LIDKSLLQQRPTEAGEPRFERLRTVLAFAVECLEESGEADRWRRRHAEHFAAMAEQFEEVAGTGRDTRARLDRLGLETANMRAAMRWALDHGEPGLAVRLATSLPALWFRGGILSLQEGVGWMDRIFEQRSALTEPERARALSLYGRMRQIGGDNSPEVVALLEESLALYRTLGNARGVARALMNLGNLKRRHGELDEAEGMFRQALALYKEIGATFGHGGALLNLGDLHAARGDREAARSFFEQAREISRRQSSPITYAFSLQYLGTMALEEGDLDRAQTLYEESQSGFERIGSRPGEMWSLYFLGLVARERGDGARARELFLQALRGVQEVGHEPGMALVILGLAALDSAEGHHRRAAVLLGAGRAIHSRASLSMSSIEEESTEVAEEASRRALGDGDYERATAEGRELSPAQAVAFAQSQVDALAL